ncbi:MAG: hypothetical protein ACF8XB_23595 [Planctomycetota bacterium JB042]
MTPLRAALLLPLLAAPLPAQDVTQVGSTRRVATTDRAASLENPFESLDRIGQDHGFQNAGARELRPIPGGRARLLYTLSRSAEPGRIEEFAAARPSFRDRWLIEELRARHDGLDTPEIVDEARRRSRDGESSTLVTRRIEVTGRQESVDAAQRFLDAVVQQNQQMVTAEVWIVRSNEDGPGDGDARVALVDAKALERRLERLMDGRSDMVLAPTVTMLGGQSASLSVLNQVAYLKDFRFERVGTELIADPEVGTVHEGVLIDLVPILGPAGRTISIGAGVTIANLKRPIPEMALHVPPIDSIAAKAMAADDRRSIRLEKDGAAVSTPAGAGAANRVTIQLPEVAVTRWSSEEIRLGDGDEGFHVVGLKERDWDEAGNERSRALEILVRISTLDPESLRSRFATIGEVLGYDADIRRAFARISGDHEPASFVGKDVFVFRADERVATGTVESVQGSLAVVAIEEGTPRSGDALGR